MRRIRVLFSKEALAVFKILRLGLRSSIARSFFALDAQVRLSLSTIFAVVGRLKADAVVRIALALVLLLDALDLALIVAVFGVTNGQKVCLVELYVSNVKLDGVELVSGNLEIVVVVVVV